MDYLLRQGEVGLRQHFLIYGKEYKLWRDGIYLGTGIYADDEIHGDVFLKAVIQDGTLKNLVFVADEWELA